LETCQALEKQAGRPVPEDRSGFPDYYEYDKYHAYGCFNGEGLGFYFKI
jgi:hypothetical protein